MLTQTRLAIALLVLTISAVLTYHFQMDTSLTISPKSGFLPRIINDQLDSGHSVGSVRTTDSSWIFDYEIRPGAQYPYVTLSLAPPSNLGFLDLSTFENIEIRTRSRGFTGAIRVQLRNVDPAYTVAENLFTMKYNELQFDPSTTPYPAPFLWADFRVPIWWTTMLKIPYWQARTQVDHISQIDITTPESVQSWSKGQLEIVSLNFYGKRIPATLFYQCLLGLWVLVGLGLISIRAIQFRRTLHKQQEREKELLTINEALSLRSKEMETMAKRDALTGVFNRNGLRDHIATALDGARQNKEALSVIMVDIDFFKKINDTQGHARGDEILKEVAQTLAKNTRLHDSVARWGGEEFLILAPSTNLQTAALAAEKLRKCIAELPSRVTCSLGVAEWRSGENVAELIHRADAALYRAKASGRNQVQSNWN